MTPSYQTEQTPETAVASLAVLAGQLINRGGLKVLELQDFVESVTVLAMAAGVSDELKAFDHQMTKAAVEHARKYYQRQERMRRSTLGD